MGIFHSSNPERGGIKHRENGEKTKDEDFPAQPGFFQTDNDAKGVEWSS